MQDVTLDLDPRVDLTKPIYEQVVDIEKADAAGRGYIARERLRLSQFA